MSLYPRVAPFVQTGDVMPFDLVADLFRLVEQLPNEEAMRKAAAEIDIELAKFLPSFSLDKFIAAEIPNALAMEWGTARKALILRGCELLPAIYKQFGIADEKWLFTVTSLVKECAEEYPSVRDASHTKKVKREVRENADEVFKLTSELIKKLDQSNFGIEAEFIQQMEAEKGVLRFEVSDEFQEFKRMLDLLAFVAKSTLMRDQLGEEVFFVGHNMTHTHIVRSAYEIAYWIGRPKFSTTPGSDFAAICSLLFELATGEADASMAGAINKFANSEWRQQFERDEVEHEQEYPDDAESADIDNFHHRKYEAKRCADRLVDWLTLRKNSTWTETELLHLDRRAMHYSKEVTRLLSENGPFILWASQMPEQEQNEEIAKRSQEMQNELLGWRIEMGKQRRDKPVD